MEVSAECFAAQNPGSMTRASITRLKPALGYVGDDFVKIEAKQNFSYQQAGDCSATAPRNIDGFRAVAAQYKKWSSYRAKGTYLLKADVIVEAHNIDEDIYEASLLIKW